MWVFRGGVDWGDNEGGERESWGDDEGDELEIVSCTVNVLWGVSYFRLTVLILQCAWGKYTFINSNFEILASHTCSMYQQC